MSSTSLKTTHTSSITGQSAGSSPGGGSSVSDSLLLRPYWLALLGVLAFALAPLWYTYAVWTWQDGHYQYFPVLWLFAGLLLWTRYGEAKRYQTDANRLIVLLGFGAVFCLTVSGHLFNSGFIGIIATITATWVLTYTLLGSGGLRSLVPVLVLLVLAVPLPLDLDKKMIFNMQFLASQLATWLLDGAGIMHVRQGVILITEESQFMTEEACSGVRSLFSSLAVIAVYSVAMRHWWPRAFANLLQAVLWVLVGNAIRVALTVYLADNVSTWFAAGLGHELLSLAVFAFILGMVASTDHILTWLCETQLGIDWGRDTEEDQLEANAGPSGGAVVQSEIFSATTLAKPSLIALTILFGLVSLIGFRVLYVQSGQGTAPSLNSIPRLPPSTENDLPFELAGWQRVNYEHVERKRDSLFASDSYVWRYRQGNLTAVVSVDCPWAEWHNLGWCYAALGWESEQQNMLFPPAGSDHPQLTYAGLQLSKKDGRHGRVLFTSVDRDRKDVRPPWRDRVNDTESMLVSLKRQAASSLGVGIGGQFAIEGLALPTSTIQLYCEQGRSYSEEQQAAVEKLFFDARTSLLASDRWNQ